MRGIATSAGRIAGAVLLGLALLLAATTARLLVEGQRNLDEGLRLLAAGEEERAAVELEDAARAYVPGSPYPARALRRLALLARAWEMRGQRERSLHGWEVIRRSVLASRNVFQPHAARLVEAERQIRRLREEAAGSDGPAADPARRPDDPDPLLTILLTLGLACWLGGAAHLCLSRTRSGRARLAGWTICAGGLALWTAMAYAIG
jgi:hypothetical protein